MIIDIAAYLLLSAVAFGIVIALWRAVFNTFGNRLERFLFWGTWIGVAILFAGWYHVFTGDRAFGFGLMLLALAEAFVVMVTVNVLAAREFRKPYDPMTDPAFLAEIEQRRRLRDERWQAAIGTTWTTEIEHTDRRLLR